MRKKLCTIAYRLGWRRLALRLSPSVVMVLDITKAMQTVADAIKRNNEAIQQAAECLAKFGQQNTTSDQKEGCAWKD